MRTNPAAPRFFPYVYLAFAAGYALSYFFRNVNAVISTELSRELTLSPGSLGLMTAAYFVAFGAMQLPAGMLLDRYGPRRVEPVLPGVAAVGALAMWWPLYGLGATVNVLAFTVLNDGFGVELTGRANTTLNLLMFIGSFSWQWGIGIVVDAARSGFGLGVAAGLKLAFALALLLYAAAFAWFVWGWRKHARSPHAVAVA